MASACSGELHRMANWCESDESPVGDWNHSSTMSPLANAATSVPFIGIVVRVVVSVMVSSLVACTTYSTDHE
jgi:hypothetical protein